MLARLAPHDKPDLGSGGVAERHRRSGLRFHSGGFVHLPIAYLSLVT
jgi:hypothetical protein